MIEAMMKLNAFEHASQMPAETPLEEHPFAKPADGARNNVEDHEFRGLLKEKKQWQPRDKTKDMSEVFTDKRPRP